MDLRKKDDYQNQDYGQNYDSYQKYDKTGYQDSYQNYNQVHDPYSDLYAPPVYREDGSMAGSPVPESKHAVKKIKIILIVLGIIFLIPSAACTGFGIFAYSDMRSDYKDSLPVTAEIVDIRTETEISSSDDEPFTYEYPTVKYTVDGTEYEQEYEYGKGQGEYRIGRKIEIRYRKDDPEILIYGMDGIWVVVKTLLIAAVSLGILPALLLFIGIKVK